MTVKDYELFANEIHNLLNTITSGEPKTWIRLCIKVFKQDNPMFQPDKFERACYKGKGIRKEIRRG